MENARDMARDRVVVASQILRTDAINDPDTLKFIYGMVPETDEQKASLLRHAKWLVSRMVSNFVRSQTHHKARDLKKPYAWFPLNYMWEMGKAWHPKRMQWEWRHTWNCLQWDKKHGESMFIRSSFRSYGCLCRE